VAEWQQIASGDGSSIPDGPLDLDNNLYLLTIESPFDIDQSVIGAIQAALSFLGVPVSVQLAASNVVQIQIGSV
jgi:hypothetical protein